MKSSLSAIPKPAGVELLEACCRPVPLDTAPGARVVSTRSSRLGGKRLMEKLKHTRRFRERCGLGQTALRISPGPGQGGAVPGCARRLLVEPEVGQVVALHDVWLRLQPHFAGAPGLGFAAGFDEFRRTTRFVRKPFTAFGLPCFLFRPAFFWGEPQAPSG